MSAFMASLFGKETVIGVDLGSAYLKAVQVAPHRDGFQIVRAAQQRTPPGSVRDGNIVDKEAVAGALRQMLKAAGINANAAVLAVAGPTVVVRPVALPKMPEPVLKKSIRFEAARYISSNLEDSALAYDILGDVPGVENQMNVMLVAAPRDLVDGRIDVVERAGLDAVSVDVEAFALLRSLVESNPTQYNDGALRAFVDMGASHTEVIIANGMQFALSRSINIAGNAFTDAIKNQLRVDLQEAERRKTEIDMGILLNPGNASPEEIEAPRSIQSMLDEMLREVRRSINFYLSQNQEGGEGKVLSEMVIVGGNAQIAGMVPYITARLGSDVRVADVFDSRLFHAAPEAENWLRGQAPRLAIAMGLAIKEFGATSGGSDNARMTGKR